MLRLEGNLRVEGIRVDLNSIKKLKFILIKSDVACKNHWFF